MCGNLRLPMYIRENSASVNYESFFDSCSDIAEIEINIMTIQKN
jgi:hypothetical protein